MVTRITVNEMKMNSKCRLISHKCTAFISSQSWDWDQRRNILHVTSKNDPCFIQIKCLTVLLRRFNLLNLNPYVHFPLSAFHYRLSLLTATAFCILEVQFTLP